MKVNPITRGALNRTPASFKTGNVESVRATGPTSAVSSVNPENASPNSLLSYGYYYDKLNKKDDENKEEFEKDRHGREKNPNYSEEEKNVINTLNNLFDKFNHAVERIKKVDIAKSTDYLGKVKNAYNKNSRFLSKAGISMDKMAHFKLSPQLLTRRIMQDPSTIQKLLNPESGVIKELMKSFGTMLV